jgi:hypothetical protein
VIAVVGRTGDRSTAAIARRVASRAATVELVATVPEGTSGDRALAELAAAGVGHAATLRSSAASLEPADLQLALRYLPDVRVVVLAADVPALLAVATEAAAWSGAPLLVAGAGSGAGTGAASFEADVARSASSSGDGGARASAPAMIVLQPPPSDPDEAFAGLVAALAVRLDAGESPTEAWRGVSRDLGLEGRPVSRGRATPSSDPDPAPRH